MSEKVRSKPSYQAWLERWSDYAHRTDKGKGQGTTMCFKINVQPDGTGFIAHMTDKGKVDPDPLRWYPLEDAVQALRDTWALAHEMANRPVEAEATEEG